MNRKLFTVLLVAVFLVASVSFISAADASDDGTNSSKTISVKINWNGDSQTDRPASITVNLIKDGKVVDSKKLSADNSWSAKFTVSEDGSYSVKQVESLSDYSISTSGSVSSGFVITNTLKEGALGSANDENLQADDNNAQNDSDSNEALGTDENNTTEENETEEGETDTNTTDENETETTGDDSPITTSPNKEKTEVVKKVEKKVIKKTDKKPKQATKTQLRNTGIPVIVLVIVAFAAAFVPFSRKK